MHILSLLKQARLHFDFKLKLLPTDLTATKDWAESGIPG